VLDITVGQGGEIALAGRFDAAQAAKVQEQFDKIAASCVIDMRQLDYISSAGLGVLLATYKRLHDRGQTMTLRNMNSHIGRIFQVSGLDKVFIIET
jgi:anti-sigma B factor antagonist